MSEEDEGKTKKRFYVIQEIISTEATYVERLKLTLEQFAQPLKALKILDKRDLCEQFDGLEQVYNLHSKHIIDGSTSQNLKFVELFEDVARNHQIYIDYLVNYENAMQRRSSLLTNNRKFSDFIESVEKNPIMHNQKLEAMLIMPVQRIPRYRLLMEQLLKYTPETHPDFFVLQQALTVILSMAESNNEAIRARENKNKMMEIMMTIEPTTRMDLLEDRNRRFVMEATLLRQCRKRYKEFQFWLFTDQLLYGEMTPLGLYTLNRRIPLNRCVILEYDEYDTVEERSKCFIIQSPAKTFKVRTKNETEKKEWVSAISLQIDTYVRNSSSHLMAAAPLWKPDFKARECEFCATAFTMIFRRHHCRNCGKIVCVNCSKKRWHLPHVDNRKMVRVCDLCHATVLSANGNNTTPKSVTNTTANTSDKSPGAGTEDDVEGEDSDGDDSDIEDIVNTTQTVQGSDLDDYNDCEKADLPHLRQSQMTSTKSENERFASQMIAPLMRVPTHVFRMARSSIAGAFSNSNNNTSDHNIAVAISPQSPPSAAAGVKVRSNSGDRPPSGRSYSPLVMFAARSNANHGDSNGDSHGPQIPPVPRRRSRSFRLDRPPLADPSDESSKKPVIAPPPQPPPPPRRPSGIVSGQPPPPPPPPAKTCEQRQMVVAVDEGKGRAASRASMPPPKPVRLSRRTDIVLHVNPVIIATQQQQSGR